MALFTKPHLSTLLLASQKLGRKTHPHTCTRGHMINIAGIIPTLVVLQVRPMMHAELTTLHYQMHCQMHAHLINHMSKNILHVPLGHNTSWHRCVFCSTIVDFNTHHPHNMLANLSILFLQMAELTFPGTQEPIQSADSLPSDTLKGNEGLRIGNICFTPMWNSLKMQRISMAHLMGLVAEGAFNPTNLKASQYSSSTAILIIFISNWELKKFIHFGMVICHVGRSLIDSSSINKLLHLIADDLEQVRAKGNSIWTYLFSWPMMAATWLCPQSHHTVSCTPSFLTRVRKRLFSTLLAVCVDFTPPSACVMSFYTSQIQIKSW